MTEIVFRQNRIHLLSKKFQQHLSIYLNDFNFVHTSVPLGAFMMSAGIQQNKAFHVTIVVISRRCDVHLFI